MKILAVMGSPRKGNSFQIVQKVENKIKEFGDIEFEYLFLKDIHLEACRGCHVCMSKGEELCPLKDSRPEIEEKMLNSDGVLFISPNYASGVTSLMKNFIDRFAYISHRPRFFNICAMVVSTSGGPFGLKQTLHSLSWFSNGGFYPVYKLGLQTHPITLSSKVMDKNQKKIDKISIKLYKALKTEKRLSPGLRDIMNFRAFRALCGYSEAIAKKYFPADLKYWTEKGWLDKNTQYFIDADINFLKRVFGLLFEKIIKTYLAKNDGETKRLLSGSLRYNDEQ